MASLSVSAFSPVRTGSNYPDPDGKMIQFPKSDLTYTTHSYMQPWWHNESLVKQPLWAWWGLKNQCISNLYRFHQFAGAVDDEKPTQSYIGLIAEAILSCPEEKLILSDIYGFILANYPYFRNKGTGWRNSIRHNLSLNDCFIKAGRSQNGKGHFWAISHLYIDDFRRGDFRRKRTYRRPSRSKKARAKLEALKRKEKHEEIIEESDKCEESKVVDVTEQSASDMRIVLKTEQFDSKNDDFEPVALHQNTVDISEAGYFGEKQNELNDYTAHQIALPSSPERTPEEYNEIDVCKEENNNDKLSITSVHHDEDDVDHETKITELRADHRPFDMAALLAPERTSQNVGILREMYPMYYNIMNLGLKTLDTADCYGSSSSYCRQCVSMLGSFHSHHGRPLYTMADYSTGQLTIEGHRREVME